MIFNAGVIMDKVGSPANAVGGKLPADVINPIFAYSLNRKLRYLYEGQYFRYSEAGNEYDYPARTPNLANEVTVLRIYDQKQKYGVSKVDAVANGTPPTLKLENGIYSCIFDGTGWFSGSPAHAGLVSSDFHVLLVAKTDFPRPAVGIWNDDNEISVSPSTEGVGKFSVNRNRGGMIKGSSNVYGCFYGVDASQNNKTVMSVNDEGHNVKSEELGDLNQIGIGRMRERYYIGEVSEVVMHLETLKQVWGSLITGQTKQFYKDYV